MKSENSMSILPGIYIKMPGRINKNLNTGYFTFLFLERIECVEK